METKENGTKVVIGVLALVSLLLVWTLAMAGDLEPSGPPDSTMKTLDEVEPRIPIPASDTPTSEFYINESGSYYLTGDRLCYGVGIYINADNVTIDLMGYTIKGLGSGIGTGIFMYGRSNVEIRNGTVCGFYNGVAESGDDAGKRHRVIHVRALSNEGIGVDLKGYGHLVKDCTAAENGYAGIRAGFVGGGCTITGNTAYDNTNYGIVASIYCLVDQNTAYGNGTNMVTGTGCVLGVNCAP